MAKPIHVLNGPNLNMLGTREPAIYGAGTLEDARKLAEERAASLGFTIVFRQTNREGELVDWVQEARTEASAVVINAAGYSHTSIALLDALKACDLPVVECHVSNPIAREDFRRHSYVSLVAKGIVSGFGIVSYALAVEAAARLASAQGQ